MAEDSCGHSKWSLKALLKGRALESQDMSLLKGIPQHGRGVKKQITFDNCTYTMGELSQTI